MASETTKDAEEVSESKVLILVLVEDGFRASSRVCSSQWWCVLILVLVEDGFRAIVLWQLQLYSEKSLNPCSCGRWLQRMCVVTKTKHE